MHIKSLTISGFKSYRDVTIVQPFSPGVNIVVGRNGAGKSNFFSAIRFVLSDAYTSLARHDRQSLLHEGSGTTSTVTAYVEIVFDNSDNRFPTGKQETVLRRTIGANKDEYTFDHKSTPKAEVMGLLESAGFSRSNPYYIVPQGRINRLTNLKDNERLDLLQEVAGTKVYEDKRAESDKIVKETENKVQKIEDLLSNIEERLEELEEEKEELQEYHAKDREKRCLEYAIYNQELEEVKKSIAQMEKDRNREIDLENRRRQESDERERRVPTLERNANDHKQKLSLLQVEKSQLEADKREASKTRTELECTISDLSNNEQRSLTRKQGLESSLKLVNDAIKKKEEELAAVLPQWEKKFDEESKNRVQLVIKQARIEALYGKRGRANQFKTQRDRDKFLSTEIESLKELLKQRQSLLESANEKLQATYENIETTQNKVSSTQVELDSMKKSIDYCNEQIHQITSDHHDNSEKRKELWKEESRLSTATENSKSSLHNAKRALAALADRATLVGLEAVERLVAQHGIEGVHGPLYLLFKVEDTFKTAVEDTIGNSLFHVVVDTDETASRVLQYLSQDKGSRVTFMPLNRLRTKSVTYPQGSDVLPMIKQLRFNPKYTLAFEHVCGRTVICPSLQSGSGYAKSHGVNVITLDGDKIDRKGSYSGGFHDVRRSRIDAVRDLQNCTKKFNELSQKQSHMKENIAQLDQRITSLVGKLQQYKTQRTKNQEDIDSLEHTLQILQGDHTSYKEEVDKVKSSLAKQNLDIKSITTNLDNDEKELSTPMISTLSDDEERELSRLTDEINNHQSLLDSVSQSLLEIAGRKNSIELELQESLIRRRDQLVMRINNIEDVAEDGSTQISGGQNIETSKTELENVVESISNMESRMKDVDKESQKLNADIETLQKQLEEISEEREEDRKAQTKLSKSVDRYISKRQLLIQRREECNKTIRELRTLPEEAYQREWNESPEKLVKLLHKAVEGLKKFSHVNKKAFEQYNTFMNQRDELSARREELKKSYESIEELTRHLDRQKEEVIKKTFNHVAKNFSEIFETLVPEGHGRLVIQKKKGDQSDEDEDEERPHSAVDNYTGVAIRVSFNSKTDEGLRIQQLSGGQKSLVALALVFAVQKCDPAPFYLFDEIDSNLDADRRTAVATMVRSLSSSAQFIITTFRPELVSQAHSHWGVLFDTRKVSTVRSISEDDAQAFVESNERSGVAEGEITPINGHASQPR